ncbi:MAG: AAA family ATPase [Candidatus Shapirobacteria bacterium]|nr:AAA family ATPase [Candidatus Shapirobacteria bacterium]
MNIFPSTLISSSNLTLIDQKINQICEFLNNQISNNNPDIFIINQQTGWTIELVRQIKNFISKKPFNHTNKIIIIYEAHQLNTESQNALLKTLEDPGDNNYLIITTSKPAKLLPTIISRCQTIKIKNELNQCQTKDCLVFSHNIKKDLALSETLSKDKTQVLPLLENQLQIYHSLITTNPSAQNSKIIQKILKTIQMIESNVDPKSALDFLFLS